MPDGLGLFLDIVLLLVIWSSTLSVLLGRLNGWQAAPGASPWRLWGPGILAWSWPAPVVGVFFLPLDAAWGIYPLLLLAPAALLIATALIVLEFRRRHAEDLVAGAARRTRQ